MEMTSTLKGSCLLLATLHGKQIEKAMQKKQRFILAQGIFSVPNGFSCKQWLLWMLSNVMM